jgi:hypothetical protein
MKTKGDVITEDSYGSEYDFEGAVAACGAFGGDQQEGNSKHRPLRMLCCPSCVTTSRMAEMALYYSEDWLRAKGEQIWRGPSAIHQQQSRYKVLMSSDRLSSPISRQAHTPSHSASRVGYRVGARQAGVDGLVKVASCSDAVMLGKQAESLKASRVFIICSKAGHDSLMLISPLSWEEDAYWGIWLAPPLS